jgi:hypothetical protein
MTAVSEATPPVTTATLAPGPVLPVLSGQDQDTDRSRTTGDRPARGVRSWPLLLLAVPAAAEVWSGWVGIAKMTGFGLVSPLPGIWSSLHLDTTVTLPVGVEAYAAYALRAWLAAGPWTSGRTRRFAKWSAICSFLLGMAGQVAYHLMDQAHVTRAPWGITTIVSCLPVLVLAMGTTLAHMLREDRTADHQPQPDQTGSRSWSPPDHDGPDTGQHRRPEPRSLAGPPSPRAARSRVPGRDPCEKAATLGPADIRHARLIAGELAASGQPVSRRALRHAGIRGSNERLNQLARTIRAEAVTAAGTP